MKVKVFKHFELYLCFKLIFFNTNIKRNPTKAVLIFLNRLNKR